MENRLLLDLISTRLDTTTLQALSKTPIWSSISPLFKNQHFWFRRAQALVNFDISKYVTDNWQEVYNILAEAYGGNLFEVGTAVLEKNEYNPIAVKILLRLGHDPSVLESQALINASKYGSAEAVQVLLAHEKIDPVPLLANDALRAAANYGKLDIMFVLLEDPRIGKKWEAIIDYEVTGVTRLDQIREIQQLIDSGDVALANITNALSIAAEQGNYGGYDAVVQLLREYNADPRLRDNWPLRIATKEWSSNVVLALISDPRVDPSIEDDLVLKRALFTARTGRLEVIIQLMTDQRVDKTGEASLNYLINESTDYLYEDIAAVLMKNVNLDLNSIPHEVMTKLIQVLSTEDDNRFLESGIESRIVGAVTLGKYYTTPAQLLEAIQQEELDDYTSLLRELILRRLDISYYLEYLQNKTDMETRRIVMEAVLSSIERESMRVVHTSPLFTAYSGFILLAKTGDAEAILNLLKSEDASPLGLQLAGTLLGAYLGKELD